MSESYTARGCDVYVVPGGALFCECATKEQARKVAFTLNQFAVLVSARLNRSNRGTST